MDFFNKNVKNSLSCECFSEQLIEEQFLLSFQNKNWYKRGLHPWTESSKSNPLASLANYN